MNKHRTVWKFFLKSAGIKIYIIILANRVKMVTPQNEVLVNALEICANLCNRCAVACLGESNVGELANCITLNQDCAAICTMVAGLVNRQSQFVNRMLAICSEICEECEAECAKHAHMEHCRVCSEACAYCAEQCSQLIVK